MFPDQLIQQLNLGEVIPPIVELHGGSFHRLWKVVTSTGIYAIKCLSPSVTTRENFKKEFELSEQIALMMSNRYLPAIAATQYNGQCVIEHQSDFFMVYPFIDGTILTHHQLTIKHAKLIGKLYFSLHHANLSIPELAQAQFYVFSSEHWESLIIRSGVKALQKLLPAILCWNNAYQEILPYLTENKIEQVVSHGDMHNQNVLWNHHAPYIIDWESSGLVNPMIELIGYGLEWSGILLVQTLNSSFFKALIQSYNQHLGFYWQTTPTQGFIGWLGHCVLAWTELNIRRMLGNLSSNPYEIKQGLDIVTNKMIPCLQFISKNEHYLYKLVEESYWQ